MTAGEINSTLKQLVSDYYHGLMTFESYREQRGRLLDELDELDDARPEAADESVNDDTAPARKLHSGTTAQVASPRSDARAPALVAADAELAAPAHAGHARRGRGIALVLGLVAVAGAVSFGLLQWRAGGPIDAAGPVAVVRPAAPQSPGETLLDQFLTRGDWGDDSRRNFVLAWNALADAQREAARDSAAFRRLADSLRRRLLEEEALGGPDTAEFRALLAFSAELAMPFTREFEARSANTTPAPSPAEPAAALDLAVGAPPEPVPASPRSTPEPTAIVTEAPAEDPCHAELASTRRPFCQDLLAGGTVGPGLVILPPGRFTMGSERSADEGPPHDVVIARAFAMAVHETSYDEFAAFCSATGRPCPERAWGDGDSPVVLVSFDEANAYARWLSAQTRSAYRLPSEAEWEYAARAGTTTPYYFGDAITPSSARSSANVPAAGPLPRSDQSVNRNPFRLLHMVGNVREWVADSWHDDYTGAPLDGSAWIEPAATTRVVRGGSYADTGPRIRSAAREPLPATTRDRATGFRIVRDIDP